MQSQKKRFYSQKFGDVLHLSNRVKKALSVLKEHHFARLLDIGCGDGTFSALLKDFSDEVYGVDIAKTAVELARKKGIKCFKVNVDIEVLPFDDCYFDGVFCGEVIEHLYDPDHLLDEIYRVLAPEGICLITTPNLASWYNRILLLLGFQPYFSEVSLKYNVGRVYKKHLVGIDSSSAVAGHIRVFTKRSLVELLKLHSFNIEKVYGADMSWLMPFPLNLIEICLSKKASLCSQLIL